MWSSVLHVAQAVGAAEYVTGIQIFIKNLLFTNFYEEFKAQKMDLAPVEATILL